VTSTSPALPATRTRFEPRADPGADHHRVGDLRCGDPDPGRAGTEDRKKYLLVARTDLLTCYFLGDRSMATFGAFVFPT